MQALTRRMDGLPPIQYGIWRIAAVLALCAGLAVAISPVQATALWRADQPDELELPLVSFQGQRYLDVRLRFDKVRSHQSRPSADRINLLDADAGWLTLREVVVEGRTYWDVVVRPTELLSVGGASQASTARVKVVGDSLSDSGTFGYKFTIQGTPDAPAQIWTDWVAAGLAAAPLCPRYVATGELEVALRQDAAATACTSLAVGGGRIHPLGVLGQSFRHQPFSVTRQLSDMAELQPYQPQDVLLMSAGGNDAADLLTLFMDSSNEGVLKYVLYLNELLPTAEVLKASSGGRSARIQAGHALMQALANRQADHLLADAWNRGAQRVVVLNVPNVAQTPRFKALLTPRSDATELVQTASAWADTFNSHLAWRLVDVRSRLILMDFKRLLDEWVRQPERVGLSNGTDPACPATGVDGTGVPDFNLATCTEMNAVNAGKGNLFADAFHGTPAVQRLLAKAVLQEMALRGWR